MIKCPPLGLVSGSLLALAVALIAAPASAQTDPAAGTPSATAPTAAEPQTDASSPAPLGDIIVTATRRATNVQDVPAAITAIGGPELQSKGLNDALQLARVTPNLFATSGYDPGNVRFAIRGLGSTDFSPAGASPVGIYIDDIFQPYAFGIGSQIYDLNRVEVLRGPQGTLFGKNTTAGAVSYFSQRPTQETEGYFNVDGLAGFYSKAAIEGAFNSPLTPTLSTRVDFRYEHRDDFVNNTFLGGKFGESDIVSGRVQLLWAPSADTSANLKVYGMSSRGPAAIYRGTFLTNLCDPANFQFNGTPYAQCNGTSLPTFGRSDSKNTPLEFNPVERYHNYGATLHVDQGFGDWKLTSISGYARINYIADTNDDGLPTDFFHSTQVLRAYTVSQEFRLATPDDGPLSAILGAYGQYDRAFQPNYVASTLDGPPTNFLLRFDALQRTTTFAGFASATWRVTDDFSIVGGARYSYERKSVSYENLQVFSGIVDLRDFNLIEIGVTNPPFPLFPEFGDTVYQERRRRSWSRLTWDISANYEPVPEVLLYAKASKGFKSGGYNLSAATFDAFSTVEPETVQAYEVGAKNELFGRRVRLNLAGFYYDFSNQQVLSTGSNGVGTFLSNAGQSTLKGFEVELQAAATDQFRIGANVGYVDATFDRFNTLLNGEPASLAGNRLPYAPKWTVSADVTYTIPLASGAKIDMQSDWNYRTRVFFDPFNFDYTSDNHLLLGNARATYTPASAAWHIAAYVQNLTDKRYFNFGYFNGTQYTARTYADGRLFGVQVGVKY